MKCFENIYVLLQKFMQEEVPTKSVIFDIYAKSLINSLEIMSYSNRSIGAGIFLAASAIDHSCTPNAVWNYIGKEIVVRTIDNVNSFADLRFTYKGTDRF